PDRSISVTAGPMGSIVEGAFRPGHFDGVLTVVLKLFNLVRPDIAVFGQKDAQQLALIRRMVTDLDAPVEIVAGPTARAPAGLALALSRALREGARHRRPDEIRRAARAVLDAAGPALRVDYLVLVDPATFTEVPEDHHGEAILAVAARVGTTRLIDNVPL